MGVVLIAIALVFFIAVDIYAVLWWMRDRRKKAAVHGSLLIPGTIQIELPPGKIRVTYEEAKNSTVVVNDNEFGTPSGLELTIKSPSGEPVQLRGPGIAGMGSSTSTGMGSSQATIGVFDVTETGTYTFTAGGEVPDAVEAKVLIGN